MTALCPACGTAIPVGDVSVGNDTALCRVCGFATTYSAVIHAPARGVLTSPPDGCHVELIGDRWRATASTRGWMFFPTCGFAIIWNAFIAGFVVSILRNPKGAPCLAFLSLHIGAGVWLIVQTLCYAMGDVEVVIEHRMVEVSTGIGPVRWTRRRPQEDARGVRKETKPVRRGTSTYLVLDSSEPLKFGTQLSDERRNFMYAVLAGRLREEGMRNGTAI